MNEYVSDLKAPPRPRDRRSFAVRPAISAQGTGALLPYAASTESRRILIVDMNNFASFPTLAIGLVVASLRNAGHQVDVICPLSHDVPAAEREWRETPIDHWKRRIHLSTRPIFRLPRDLARRTRTFANERPHPVVLREVQRALDQRYDVVLLSAYLQHFNTVSEIGKLAAARGVPLVVGGPMFSVAGTAQAWVKAPGVTAVVGAEVDRDIPAIIQAACQGQRLDAFPGVWLPDGRTSGKAPPLRRLDETPMADFSDFPWDRYPVRIIPVMTGRGCQWDKCHFCSDVVSVSGRTFRTRSVENVLLELQEQSRRHNTSNFLFLDLKLNSYPDMIRGIAAQIQGYVRGAEWIGTVHVDTRKDNGLSFTDLSAAVRGGMRRISFGLESGSQRMLDLMNKGSTVEANSEFIRNAHQAGLSVRCTMFKGYPGETAKDMEETADFLERHIAYLDRVRFNEFSLLQDTPIFNALQDRALPDFRIKSTIDRRAQARYVSAQGDSRAYRRAKLRALNAVYEINRRPLRASARQFDGLM